jgi:predicted HTH domain antitoxin
MRAIVSPELPPDLWAALQASGYSQERLSTEALRHYAAVLFSRKVLSLEPSARLAGMSLWDFIPFLGEQGIPVADYDDDEIQAELDAAQWLADLPPK